MIKIVFLDRWECVALWSRHIQSKKFKRVTKTMLFVRPNEAGTMQHLTVLISTEMFPTHSNEVTMNKSSMLLTHLHVTWDTLEEQPLNLLFITTNNRFMNALKWHIIYNVQVPPWALIRLCPVPPRLDWSPERLLLLPAACAALSASPAPTEPASTPDGTLQPAGTSEQTAMGSKPPVIFEHADWDSLTFNIVLVLLVWDLSAFVGKTQLTGIKLGLSLTWSLSQHQVLKPSCLWVAANHK